MRSLSHARSDVHGPSHGLKVVMAGRHPEQPSVKLLVHPRNPFSVQSEVETLSCVNPWIASKFHDLQFFHFHTVRPLDLPRVWPELRPYFSECVQ